MTSLFAKVWQAASQWSNPTRGWHEDEARVLELDLDRQRFCGTAIDEPLERLSHLGPATRWSFALEFPRHGIHLCGGRTIDEVSVFFGHPDEPRQGKYRGRILYRREELTLSYRDDEARLIALFGQPYWRDKDADETILFYEFGAVEWQVELGRDGCLKCFSLARPLLADPAQREAYGGTKPWPPPGTA
jgi:hypothetical protein